MRLWLFMALLALTILGCSNSSPVTPSTKITGDSPTGNSNPVNLFSLVDITIDQLSGEIQIVPLRNVEFTANVIKFMQPPESPIHLMSISIDPDSVFSMGYVVVNISYKHPFPGIDTFTGFDVRGIVFGNGTTPGLADPSASYGGNNDIRLLNADGYTRWFNPTEFTSFDTIFGFTKGSYGTPSDDWSARLNGYKYFCNSLGSTTDVASFFNNQFCPNPRGIFGTSSTNSRRYELQFPMTGNGPDLSFQYAVIGCWSLPEPSPPQNIPDDFSLEANCQEAYAISVNVISDLYYENESSKGGSMAVQLKIFDHQGVENPDGVPGEIASVHIETPMGPIGGGGLKTFDPSALSSALVSQDEKSATWLLQIPEAAPSGAGDWPTIIVVESTSPTTYSSGIPGFVYPETAKLAAYQFTLTPVASEPPTEFKKPVAIAQVLSDMPLCPNIQIELTGIESYDQDQGGSSIMLWEWDLDNDGDYSDAVGPTVGATYDDLGFYYIDLRVTDNEGDVDYLDEKIQLIVGEPTWVDDDADPLTADGSFENPWTTIQEGIMYAFGGCEQKWVLVRDGTYDGSFGINNDITVEGFSDPPPLLTTDEGLTDPMVVFHHCDNSRIRNFRAQPKVMHDPEEDKWNSAFLLTLGCSNCVIEDIEAVDNPGGETCTWFIETREGVENTTIRNITIDGYHTETGLLIAASGDNVVITDCVIQNITVTSPRPWHLISVVDSDNMLIARNVIGHVSYSEPFDSLHLNRGIFTLLCTGTIRNNLIFDLNSNLDKPNGGVYGISVEDATDLVIEHNTVTGLASPMVNIGIIVQHEGENPGDITHRSHIVGDFTAYSPNQTLLHSFAGLFSGTGPKVLVHNSCAWNIYEAFKPAQQVVEGDGMVYENSAFVNPMFDDFRVSEGSPCSGTAHDGTDMGAYGGSDPLTWLPG